MYDSKIFFIHNFYFELIIEKIYNIKNIDLELRLCIINKNNFDEYFILDINNFDDNNNEIIIVDSKFKL